MKFILMTHNVTLTKAIEDHVLIRIEKLEHFDRWAVDARVTLEHDNTVNVDGIHAELKDGVLRVSLPKAEAAKSRKITIN